MQPQATTHVSLMAESPSAARRETMAAALMAACLGAFLVLGVGFLQVDAVHNAAHDTRHSIGFPCH